VVFDVGNILKVSFVEFLPFVSFVAALTVASYMFISAETGGKMLMLNDLELPVPSNEIEEGSIDIQLLFIPDTERTRLDKDFPPVFFTVADTLPDFPCVISTELWFSMMDMDAVVVVVVFCDEEPGEPDDPGDGVEQIPKEHVCPDEQLDSEDQEPLEHVL
jgi:hypothetical protein